MTKPQKSMKGITPSSYEWQFDHILSKYEGGTNASYNLQILSRKANRQKWK